MKVFERDLEHGRPELVKAFAVDQPRPGSIVDHGAMTVSGWILARTRVTGIRVLADGEPMADGTLCVARSDVIEQHRENPRLVPGFLLSIDRFPSRFEALTVEVRLAGRWRLLARYRVVDRPAYRPVFFMHIAKTAGSTVNEYARNVLGPAGATVHLESDPRWHDKANGAFEHASFLSGHLSLPVIRGFVDVHHHLLATTFRDPLPQLASHLCWVRSLCNDERRDAYDRVPVAIQDLARKLASCDFSSASSLRSVLAALTDTERALLDNCQTRYLLGPNRGEPLGPAEVSRALGELDRFDLLGLDDDVAGFLARLAGAAGWPHDAALAHRRVNVTGNRYGLDLAEPATRSALSPLVAADEQIVAAVRARAAALALPDRALVGAAS